MSDKKIYFVSLGCPKNLVDTEIMLGLAQDEGFTMSEEAEDSDILVINTCSFIADARQESVDGILELAEIRERYPNKKLVVTGCLPQRYPDELQEELPEVDHFVGTSNIPQFVDILRGEKVSRNLVDPTAPSWLYSHNSPRLRATPFYTAYVKIAEGCDRNCAFCAIPSFRGKQQSRSIESIAQEVQDLASQGVVEINLIAQELNGYGRDLSKKSEQQIDLLALLKVLETNPSPPWIRLLYLYPQNFSDELIDFIAHSKKILPYIDMPIQHISTPILKAMKRASSGDDLRKLIKKLRHSIPNLTLRTTLLVGFPEETEKDFDELYEFIQEEPFDRLGVFSFSKEEGTLSYEMTKGEVSSEIAEERREKIYQKQANISKQRLNNLIGQEIEVLVEGISEESELLLQGRFVGQAPNIDGVVYINDGEAQAGDIVNVLVEQAGEHDLVGAITSHVVRNSYNPT